MAPRGLNVQNFSTISAADNFTYVHTRPLDKNHTRPEGIPVPAAYYRTNAVASHKHCGGFSASA